MMRIVFLVIIILSDEIHAQSGWQLAKDIEVAEAYGKSFDWLTSNHSYAFRLKYTSYKNHMTNEVNETSEGYCKRVDNMHRTMALGTLIIQNEFSKTVIDTVEKMIVITNPDNSVPVIANNVDILSLLKNTKALKKKKGVDNTTYRIEFNKNTLFEIYDFTVNDKGFLEKLVYYYSEQTQELFESTSSGQPVRIKTKPRLEISFSNYEVPAKIQDGDFREKNILLTDSKKITLLNKYKKYQVKDYRIKK